MLFEIKHILLDTSEARLQNPSHFSRFLTAVRVNLYWHSSSASNGSILPVFNDDRCYFTPAFLLSSDKVLHETNSENPGQKQIERKDAIWTSHAPQHLIFNFEGNESDDSEKLCDGSLFKLLPHMSVIFQKLRLTYWAKNSYPQMPPQRVQLGHWVALLACGGAGECFEPF